jgi:hypothetical protein
MLNQTKEEMLQLAEMELVSSIVVFPKSKIRVLIQEIHNRQEYKFKTKCRLNKFLKLIKGMDRCILVQMALLRKHF